MKEVREPRSHLLLPAFADSYLRRHSTRDPHKAVRHSNRVPPGNRERRASKAKTVQMDMDTGETTTPIVSSGVSVAR